MDIWIIERWLPEEKCWVPWVPGGMGVSESAARHIIEWAPEELRPRLRPIKYIRTHAYLHRLPEMESLARRIAKLEAKLLP